MIRRIAKKKTTVDTKKVARRASGLPAGYANLLSNLKERIASTQVKAAISVNRELVLLYWHIGREILKRQNQEKWGAKVTKRLSKDLSQAFPDMRGFTPRNLLFMRAFADAYHDEEIVKQLASQIPWFHNVRLIQMVKEPVERQWYIQQTIENGWSRNILVMQIKSDLYNRQGKAASNFDLALPKPQSDLAQNTLKDPYIFDFLSIGREAAERELHKELLVHLREFLLELGVGFAFVGSQVHLEVGGEDFFIDLLFYHLKLRAYVVIDLKVREFKPEYAGKMSFYLSAVDDLLRHPDDHPSIGLILCRSGNKVVAEYALRGYRKPIGVSAYELTRRLPKDLKTSLPSIKELEAELGDPEKAKK